MKDLVENVSTLLFFMEADKMSKNFPPDLQEKMTVFCNEILEQMAGNHTKNHEEFLSQWQKLHTLYLTSTAELLQEWTEKY